MNYVRDGHGVGVVQSRTSLGSEVILSTTEEVLRRHGPSKATVVDVARALGVSHTAVYRYFPSKAALREAVARRWLNRANDELLAVVGDSRLASPDRPRAWLVTLFTVKRTSLEMAQSRAIALILTRWRTRKTTPGSSRTRDTVRRSDADHTDVVASALVELVFQFGVAQREENRSRSANSGSNQSGCRSNATRGSR